MKRIILLSLLIVLGSCSSKKKDTERQPVVIPNDLPSMQIRMLDGNTLEAKTIKGPAVLILFQPDCDHCQNEARQFREYLSAFKNYSLYFVSSGAIPEIEKFSVDYKLSGIENVAFGFTTVENILNNFGPIQAPSVYIYSEQEKLVQKFNGEVDISVILKYL